MDMEPEVLGERVVETLWDEDIDVEPHAVEEAESQGEVLLESVVDTEPELVKLGSEDTEINATFVRLGVAEPAVGDHESEVVAQ